MKWTEIKFTSLYRFTNFLKLECVSKNGCFKIETFTNIKSTNEFISIQKSEAM